MLCLILYESKYLQKSRYFEEELRNIPAHTLKFWYIPAFRLFIGFSFMLGSS